MYKFNIHDIVYSLDPSLPQKAFVIHDRRLFADHVQYCVGSKRNFSLGWMDEKYFVTKEKYIEALSKFSIGQNVIISLSVTRNTDCESMKQREGVKYQVQDIDANVLGDIYCFIGDLWLKQDELEEYIELKEITFDEIANILQG